jgi:hypothetical protein
VFELATGEYFKWAAHDDVCRPEFLRRCVEVLDREPEVVLCFTQTLTIDRNRRSGDARYSSRRSFRISATSQPRVVATAASGRVDITTSAATWSGARDAGAS